MNITLSKLAGFCPGVKRADMTLSKLIENRKDNEELYTLGHLIHNNLYNEGLEKKGIFSLTLEEAVSKVNSKDRGHITLVIRTHGIKRDEYAILCELEKSHNDFTLIDMTCPSVKRIHRIAEENTDGTTCFLLFCNPNHPEAVGIMSYANGLKYTITSPDDLSAIDFDGKTPILCSQTTENLETFEKIKLFLKKL